MHTVSLKVAKCMHNNIAILYYHSNNTIVSIPDPTLMCMVGSGNKSTIIQTVLRC